MRRRQRAASSLFSLTIVSTSRRETLKQGKMAPSVPESVLKKRKRNEEWAAKKAGEAATAKSAAKAKRQDIFKRAEKYVAEYRSQVGHRRQRNSSHILAPPEAARASRVLCSGPLAALRIGAPSPIALPYPVCPVRTGNREGERMLARSLRENNAKGFLSWMADSSSWGDKKQTFEPGAG